jgi:hypothetical protein
LIRLAVSVEGATEREFVARTLGPHFATLGVLASPIPLIGPPNLDRIARELTRLLPSFDRVTTLYDYYGFKRRAGRDPDSLEAAIAEAAPAAHWGRVVPYVQVHEFEALVFADPAVAGRELGAPGVEAGMRRILDECGRPEQIDDGYETCPSRRLKALHPPWDKTLHGPMVTAAIGLPGLRAACPRFNAWLGRLEGLSAAATRQR